MTDERFEQLVSEGIERIPTRFLKQIQNVAIITADLPSKEQLGQQDMADPYELLGLYEGVPLTERGDMYGVGEMIIPDKITIFKLPILAAAKDDEEKIRQMVRDTVWHEIGHYFGWDDDELYEREDDGTNFSK